jgi:hypothetical protein
MHGVHHRPLQNPPRVPRSNDGERRAFRNPLSIVVAIVIVITPAVLGVIGLLGGELYARHHATSVLAKVVECVTEDRASVSLGARPLLLQLMTGEFSGISIETAGNQFREAKGMKVHMQIAELRLQNTGSSRVTLDSVYADISWSNDGIKQTLQDAIPLFGGLITAVTTKPSDGTIELHTGLGSITARPQLADGGLALQVLIVGGFGFMPPRESLQRPLDVFASTLRTSMPADMHADSLQLTDTGVSARFSARHAIIPLARGDACLAGP